MSTQALPTSHVRDPPESPRFGRSRQVCGSGQSVRQGSPSNRTRPPRVQPVVVTIWVRIPDLVFSPVKWRALASEMTIILTSVREGANRVFRTQWVMPLRCGYTTCFAFRNWRRRGRSRPVSCRHRTVPSIPPLLGLQGVTFRVASRMRRVAVGSVDCEVAADRVHRGSRSRATSLRPLGLRRGTVAARPGAIEECVQFRAGAAHLPHKSISCTPNPAGRPATDRSPNRVAAAAVQGDTRARRSGAGLQPQGDSSTSGHTIDCDGGPTPRSVAPSATLGRVSGRR